MQSVTRKQKLNTRSITEFEMVDVDDASVYILWEVLFVEWQGYIVYKNILYQEKKNAILVEVNGKMIAGKRIQALDICYFFMADQVEKESVQIEYCPIDEMWGDFITKPMQGEKFRNFRNYVLDGDE